MALTSGLGDLWCCLASSAHGNAVPALLLRPVVHWFDWTPSRPVAEPHERANAGDGFRKNCRDHFVDGLSDFVGP